MNVPHSVRHTCSPRVSWVDVHFVSQLQIQTLSSKILNRILCLCIVLAALVQDKYIQEPLTPLKKCSCICLKIKKHLSYVTLVFQFNSYDCFGRIRVSLF